MDVPWARNTLVSDIWWAGYFVNVTRPIEYGSSTYVPGFTAYLGEEGKKEEGKKERKKGRGRMRVCVRERERELVRGERVSITYHSTQPRNASQYTAHRTPRTGHLTPHTSHRTGLSSLFFSSTYSSMSLQTTY